MGKVMYFLIIVLLIGVSVTASMDWGPFDNSSTLSSNGNNASTVTTGESDSEGKDDSVITTGVSSSESEYLAVDDVVGVELDSDDLVEMVAPAVVSIVTETVSYNFWHQAIPQTAAGTGLIISSDGYIVTNNHVVEDAEKVTVTLSDGSTYEATSVNTDPETDLAVVKIDASDLSCLSFLSGSLEQLDELETVVAVGNALALDGGPTWTLGVVSNLGRTIEFSDGTILYDLVQTDAAINPGNSGGPLVNMAGQVVGINVAIASDAENIGFAISTDTAIPVINSLIEDEEVVRPWLGVSMLTVNSTVEYQYDLSVDQGVLIVQVASDSPAEEAGLMIEDVVTSIDGQEVTNAEEMRLAIQSHQAGNEIEIIYYRGSQQHTVQAILIETPV